MKILIKENHMFGGYVGRLVNENLTNVKLPSPINIMHRGYTNKDKQKIIDLCQRDAKNIFDIENIEVIEV